jgi:TRAP-type C4-dicarboxylate transport system substrate-binding protein
MNFRHALLAAALTLAGSAFAQTRWDLPAAYPASNFHTVNLEQFAKDVDQATAGKLKIQVHANASLFKADQIKRAVQQGQAQIGEILLVNYQNEWQLFGADGLPFLADSYDDAMKLYRHSAPCWTRSWLNRACSCCTRWRGRRKASIRRSRSTPRPT